MPDQLMTPDEYMDSLDEQDESVKTAAMSLVTEPSRGSDGHFLLAAAAILSGGMKQSALVLAKCAVWIFMTTRSDRKAEDG